jgi:uncharacterized RDD family membrane protein YckC
VSTVEPGWYKDPAEPTTQRYWDGEGWLGDPIPADATPPDGPPAAKAAPEPAPAPPPAPLPSLILPPSMTPGPPPSAPPPSAPPDRPPAGPAMPPPPGVPGRPGMAGPPPGWMALPPGYVVVAEPRPHGLMLAGAGSRLVARMVDVLAVLVLAAIANFWFAMQFWQVMQPYLNAVLDVAERRDTSIEAQPVPPDSATLLVVLMTVVLTAVWFAYEVPASANSGQTLGKRLLGIKVVRVESEEQLGFGRSFRRWGRLGLPTLLWAVCCGLTFILQAIDCLFVVIDKPLRQALHDKSAATVVVQVPRASRPETAQRRQEESVTTGGRHADPS